MRLFSVLPIKFYCVERQKILLFFIVSIYCLLAPNRETCMDDTWISSIVGLSGSVKLFSVKLFLLAPLWWGILCYILLRLANPYLKEHGVKLQINNRIYKALIKIFTIAFLIALIYWSCGFTLYVVFPPMPFLVGYYIMNHRIILGISWCIEAILIYVSFET